MSAYPSNIGSLPSVNQDFIDLSSCSVIDVLPFDPKSKEIINKAIDGTLFVNPVQGLIDTSVQKLGEFQSNVLAEAGNAAQSLMSSALSIDGVDPDNPSQGLIPGAIMVENPEAFLPGGIPNPAFDGPDLIPESAANFVERKSREIAMTASRFQTQSEILSGVSLSPNPPSGNSYNSDGGLDDSPGIMGVQNIANGFNNVKNSLEEPDEVFDKYSEFFGSVSGPGSELYNSVNAALEGDVTQAFAAFPTSGDGSINFQDLNQLTEMANAFDAANTAAQQVDQLINNEKALVTAAVEYLGKVGFGFSILAMLADPCFGQKLAKKIFDI